MAYLAQRKSLLRDGKEIVVGEVGYLLMFVWGSLRLHVCLWYPIHRRGTMNAQVLMPLAASLLTVPLFTQPELQYPNMFCKLL